MFASFSCSFLHKRLKTGKTVLVSVLLIGLALMCFSLTRVFAWLIVINLFLGFGRGTVDTEINYHVAIHYSSRSMSWLHLFWGAGASVGSLLMSWCIGTWSWRAGYGATSVFALALCAIVLVTLKSWDRSPVNMPPAESQPMQHDGGKVKIKRALPAMLFCMFYTAGEVTVSLWGGSYLVSIRMLSSEISGTWISMFFIGIMLGRLLSGFAAGKIGNRKLILYGLLCALAETF